VIQALGLGKYNLLMPGTLRLPSARALRHRNFRLFFAGQLISLIGTWMQSVAQSWLVYSLTGSTVLLGLVGFASQIPVFLLAPIGGVVADAMNRHRVLLMTQMSAMVLAAILAALTILGSIQIWQIFVLASLLGIVNAFDIPARQAFIVEMVGKEDLVNAIALNSSMVNGARLVGPAVAGVLVSMIGEGWCFAINAASYVAVLIGLVRMDVPRRTLQTRAGSALRSVSEGFEFVVATPPVRSLMLLLGLVSLMGMPYSTLMPVFADRILRAGPGGLGVLMGMSGAGALTGALALASKQSLRGLGRWVAWSSAAFGASLILFSASRTFWLSAVLLVPVGCSMMVQMASSNTLIQSMVPDHLRGRVMSIYSMMFMGMAPFGALLAGAIAYRLGAPLTVALGGVACLIGAAVFGVRLPAFRTAAREIILALQSAGGEPAAATSTPAVAKEG
jgi:MFS family permease